MDTIIRQGQTMQRFGPKKADHPSVGEPCWICDVPFEAGDYTTLFATHPADEEEQAKADAGRAHTAAAQEIHWTCASRLPMDP